MKKINLIAGLLFLLAFYSCKKEEITTLSGFAKSGTAIIVNEGSFGSNNGSLSFFDEGKIINNIFEKANGGLVVGDVVQYYTKVGDKGLIVVNNSQKVVIVNAEDFMLQKTITQDLSYPRYAVSISDKRAYVTNGSGNGTLVVIDVDSLKVIKTIEVGKGPEMLVRNGTLVYVCNSGGFSNDDSTVSVVNTLTDTEIKKIKVGNVPIDLDVDINGNIWVLCKGIPDYSAYPAVKRLTPAQLVMINGTTKLVEKTFQILPIGSIDDVQRLAMSGDGKTVYYNKGDGIFAMNINGISLPTSPLINGYFYGLDVDPNTGSIFGLDAGNFSSNGSVKKYTTSGVKLDSLPVGIAPNNLFFNK